MDNINKINMDDYKPLRDLVFENLREAILKGDLNPGDRLMEVQLANKLGVSRTPVREAIRKLELEGLVIMLPRKGAYVADMSLKDIIEVLEIRASLEGLAAYLASERMSDEDIKKLEENNLIELVLTPKNKKDKRVILTPVGEKIAKEMVIPLMKAEKQAFGNLTKEERKQLLSLIQKYEKLLRIETNRMISNRK